MNSPQLSKLDRFVNKIVDRTGSVGFIIGFNVITFLYALLQTILHGFDQFPFVLYILLISVLAIDMSALILLAQNKQSAIDRAHAERSYSHNDRTLNLQEQQMVMLRDIQTQATITRQAVLDMLEGEEKFANHLRDLRDRSSGLH